MPTELPLYDPEKICPKCHGACISLSYCEHHDYSLDCRYPSPWHDVDHFHRVCQQCRFTWMERTLEAPHAD